MASFACQWMYNTRKGNIADPLSWMPTFYSMVLVRDDKALTSTPILLEQETLVNRIRLSYSKDLEFPKDKYEFQHGIFCNKDRIAIPKDTDLRNHIIQEFHDSVFLGPLDRDKPLESITAMFTWKGTTKYVAEYIKHCHVCQTCKLCGISNQGSLVLPEIAETPWTNISIDIITWLPMSTAVC